MNILFICTSNKDRSPALEEYFKEVYPEHSYRSAGVNKYFTSKKGTHYLTQHDLTWADIVVYAEQIHFEIVNRDFRTVNYKDSINLDLGEYKQGQIGEDYLLKADAILRPHLT